MRKLLFILIMFLLTGCSSQNMKCDEGVLEDGKCKIVEEIEAKLTCREGYTYDEEKDKCVNTLTIDAKKVSICPNGYEIGNDVWCYSEKVYEKENVKECVSDNIKEDDKLSSTYEKDNACYEKICTEKSEDGKTCLTYQENKIDYKEDTVCPKGTISVDGQCRKKQWMTKKVSCEIGEMVDNKCVITDEIDREYICDDGFSLNEKTKKCEKVKIVNPQ